MDVERMVHGMVLGHAVLEADLDPVADPERPLDLPVVVTRVAVDELPRHVASVRRPVHRGHEILPFQPVGRVPAFRTAFRTALRTVMAVWMAGGGLGVCMAE